MVGWLIVVEIVDVGIGTKWEWYEQFIEEKFLLVRPHLHLASITDWYTHVYPPEFLYVRLVQISNSWEQLDLKNVLQILAKLHFILTSLKQMVTVYFYEILYSKNNDCLCFQINLPKDRDVLELVA